MFCNKCKNNTGNKDQVIKIGEKIHFKAKCICFDDKAEEYHFKIQKVKIFFTIKKVNGAFKNGQIINFDSICLYIDDTAYQFTLDGYNDGFGFDLSQKCKWEKMIILNFLKKSK